MSVLAHWHLAASPRAPHRPRETASRSQATLRPPEVRVRCEERYEGAAGRLERRGSRSSRGSLRASPPPDLTEPHQAVPRVELPAVPRVALTRALRGARISSGQPAAWHRPATPRAGRARARAGYWGFRRVPAGSRCHPEASRAIAGSVFSSRSGRAESCPGSQSFGFAAFLSSKSVASNTFGTPSVRPRRPVHTGTALGIVSIFHDFAGLHRTGTYRNIR